MNTIDASQLSRFRVRLRERAGSLREEIRQTLLRCDQEQYAALVERARDLEDDAVADLLVDINLAEIDRDVVELRQVESALQRIAGAAYGRCEDCGELIEIKRLDANPAAECCLNCQAARERLRVRTPTL